MFKIINILLFPFKALWKFLKVAKTFLILLLLVGSLTLNAGQFLGSSFALVATSAITAMTGIKAATQVGSKATLLATEKALTASQIALRNSQQALAASKASLVKATARITALTAASVATKKALQSIATKMGIRTAGRGVKVLGAGTATVASGWIPWGGAIVATGFLAWEAHDICSSLAELKELEDIAGLETKTNTEDYAICGYTINDVYNPEEGIDDAE